MLLFDVKGHKNIVEFIAISETPCFALMQEYLGFSFTFFVGDKTVNSMQQFPQHVDEIYDFKGFENLNGIIARDIVNGVSCGFWHGPATVLI